MKMLAAICLKLVVQRGNYVFKALFIRLLDNNILFLKAIYVKTLPNLMKYNSLGFYY